MTRWGMGRADGRMHTLSQEPSGRTAVGRGLGGRGNCWSDGGFPASQRKEGKELWDAGSIEMVLKIMRK